MAATTSVPVSRAVGLPHRRFRAATAVVCALVLAAAALMSVAVSRYTASAASDHRPGMPIVVPHPTPGPFGS
jgi:hypothetical protein